MRALVGWLRKDRWFTDESGADRMPWQFSAVGEGRYGTSILGVINGILPRLGIVLVAHLDERGEQPVPPYLSLRRRWWAL